MAPHRLAGLPATPDLLIDPAKLERDYYALKPDPAEPGQLVSFGTSGHRGTASNGTFNEAHILAIAQAICEYRRTAGIDGPILIGKDTHALSVPAERTTVEVFAANGVETLIQGGQGFTPTPSISRAILAYNRSRTTGLADGVVITPSHNPPADGGFKYNPPNGGPADTDVTDWIQNRANNLLRGGNTGINRQPYETARHAPTIHEDDFLMPYVRDLVNVIDLDLIRDSGIRIGIDPLGGAAVHYWEPIAETYRLSIEVVNKRVDPTFGFMTVDHDGKIRMDCSSPYAMAGLVRLKDDFQIAFGNDPDADRHGIVTPSLGLLNPNHYLAVAIRYLLENRPKWPVSAAIGKTLVSSNLIDRVVADLGRKLFEAPVGFKWFAPGLFDGTVCFGGEESAGASFLRRDGSVWTTDKDGLILGLLAAEMRARTGRDPGEHYQELTAQFGTPHYRRIDAPASPAQKAAFKKLTPEAVTATELAGEQIVAKLTNAPGNGAAIGGLKVVAANGWFAARPSGTENLYKLYAESFRDESHLSEIINQAQEIVSNALGA
jgi:phosphoglucomutase